MAEATFTDLIDWLSDHNGKSVSVEVGTDDPDADPSRPTDTIPLRFRSTLGAVENAENEDYGRKAVLIRLHGGTDSGRVYFDPAWITRIQIHSAVKVWFHGAFYIALAA